MEHSGLTDATFEIYRALRDEGFDRCGVVIQSYLRRSLRDVRALAPLTPNVRLVKGIYVEPKAIAYTDPGIIQRNFVELLEELVAAGSYVAVATHDQVLVDEALRVVDRHRLDRSDYEFQTLLGVAERVRRPQPSTPRDWDHDYDARGQARRRSSARARARSSSSPRSPPQVAHLTRLPAHRQLVPAAQEPAAIRALMRRRLSNASPGCRRSGARFVFQYSESLTLMIRHPRTSGRLGALRSAAFMRSQLKDPEVLREKVWPDYTFGCKRILFSSDFLPALRAAQRRARHRRRSTRSCPRACAPPTAACTSSTASIWATGFRTNDFMFPMADHRPRRARRCARPGQTGRTRTSASRVPGLPEHVRHVRAQHEHLGRLDHLLPRGAGRVPAPGAAAARARAARGAIEVRAEVEARQRPRAAGALRRHGLDATATPGTATSSGRIVANWPGYMREYLQQTSSSTASEFTLRPAAPSRVAAEATAGARRAREREMLRLRDRRRRLGRLRARQPPLRGPVRARAAARGRRQRPLARTSRSRRPSPNQFHTKLDWDFATEPEPHVDGRSLYIPRGKSLGGSSSMNAMLYVRGRPLDYDGWEAQGAPGWGYARRAARTSCKSEDNARGASEFHGAGGPLQRRRAALAAADRPARCSRPARRPASRASPTTTGPSRTASSMFQVTQKNGRRWSAADAFLRPALKRAEPRGAHRRAPSLGLELEGDRAVGVRYAHAPRRARSLRAEREVILRRGRDRLAAAAAALGHRRRPTSCAPRASRCATSCRASAATSRTTRS